MARTQLEDAIDMFLADRRVSATMDGVTDKLSLLCDTSRDSRQMELPASTDKSEG